MSRPASLLQTLKAFSNLLRGTTKVASGNIVYALRHPHFTGADNIAAALKTLKKNNGYNNLYFGLNSELLPHLTNNDLYQTRRQKNKEFLQQEYPNLLERFQSELRAQHFQVDLLNPRKSLDNFSNAIAMIDPLFVAEAISNYSEYAMLPEEFFELYITIIEMACKNAPLESLQQEAIKIFGTDQIKTTDEVNMRQEDLNFITSIVKRKFPDLDKEDIEETVMHLFAITESKRLSIIPYDDVMFPRIVSMQQAVTKYVNDNEGKTVAKDIGSIFPAQAKITIPFSLEEPGFHFVRDDLLKAKSSSALQLVGITQIPPSKVDEFLKASGDEILRTDPTIITR